jgi:hypothetical protein
MTIYRIKFPNGKSYIGQTVKSAKKRLKEHERYAFEQNCTTKLCNAMRKYKGEYELEIIQDSDILSKYELDFLEKYYISYYNTFGERGYNMTKGGDGTQLFKENNGMYGRNHTEETRKKISEKRIGKYTGKDSYWSAYNRTEEELKENARKAAKTRKENFEKLSPEEKELEREKRSLIKKLVLAKVDRELHKAKSVEAWYKKSEEEKKEINLKKGHPGEKNSTALIFILENPNKEKFEVKLMTGLQTFCEENKLDLHSLTKTLTTKECVQDISRYDTTKRNKELLEARLNTIGWKIIEKRRINK